jgi:hypothetical protein
MARKGGGNTFSRNYWSWLLTCKMMDGARMKYFNHDVFLPSTLTSILAAGTLYGFARAAVTKYHRLGVVKHKLSGVTDLEAGSPRSRCLQGCLLSWAVRTGSVLGSPLGLWMTVFPMFLRIVFAVCMFSLVFYKHTN